LKDPEVPLVITEGELKAACGCAHGIPVIGLGGVWNFQSARLGLALLPELAATVWEGRFVAICYDSDSNDGTKGDVQQAQYRLTRQLAARGARVHHVDLPPINGTKVGLDDYIVAQGVTAFEELIAQAEEMQYSEELHKLNDEVAYIRASQEMVELRTGIVMSADKFTNVAYRPRRYIERVGDKTTMKYAAKEWLEWPYRNEVHKLTYRPGNAQITDEREYNLWTPPPLIPVKGNVRPWLDMTDRLLEGLSPSNILWVRRWFAAPLQQPDRKLRSAVFLWGVQGAGKGLLGATMQRLYGEAYLLIKDEDIAGRFTYWAHRRQFIHIDEMEQSTKRELSTKLKSMITRDQVTIELKMVAPYTIPDRLVFFFNSNSGNGIYIDPGDDRRFFVHKVPEEKLSRRAADEYFDWLDNKGGAAAVLHYLMYELDMGDFNWNGDVPRTAAKDALDEANFSELEAICHRIAQDRALELSGRASELHLVTTKELLKLLDPDGKKKWTPNYLSTCLRRTGFKLTANGLNNVTVTTTSPGGQNIKATRERVWAICREPECEKLSAAKATEQYASEHNVIDPAKFSAENAKRKAN
jgi:hypothetical protein